MCHMPGIQTSESDAPTARSKADVDFPVPLRLSTFVHVRNRTRLRSFCGLDAVQEATSQPGICILLTEKKENFGRTSD